MKLLVISALWCPSCLLLDKELKKVMMNIPDLEMEKLDYDLDEEEVLKYQVGDKLPVLILKDRNDRERGRLTGEKKCEEIMLFIKENC